MLSQRLLTVNVFKILFKNVGSIISKGKQINARYDTPQIKYQITEITTS